MKQQLLINRAHELGLGECQDIAKELLDKMVERYGGTLCCRGEDYEYSHATGVDVVIQPRAGMINIDVQLGILARAFAPTIEQELNKVLDKYIVKA